MLPHMSRLIIITIIMFFTTLSAVAEPELLHANDWLLPKKASAILNMPAIHKSMIKIQNNPDSILSLKYPGGDEGTLWVTELRSWLVTLGLSSSRIRLVQGSAISTTIEFDILLTNISNEDNLRKEQI